MQKKLKIALVIDDTLDSNDGVQQHVKMLGKWLEQSGHQVDYLCGQTSKKSKNTYSLSRNINVKFNRNTLTVPFMSKNKEIRTLLQNKNYDLIHVQMPYSPMMSGKIIKYAYKDNIKIVGTFHILPYSTFQKLATKSLILLQKRTIKKFNKIISVSNPTQEFISNELSIDSVVIPNFIDFDVKKSKITSNSSQKEIVFLGRMVPRKGCQELIKAVNYLVNELNYTKFKLNIYGKGPELDNLITLVNRYKLDKYVNFAGFINERDKYKVFQNADLAVFPSISGESFGIVLLESIAMGSKITMGGNNPGYSFLLSDTPEVLFNPIDTKSFAEKIKHFLSNNSDIERVNNKQLQLLKSFKIISVGPKIEDIYYKAVEN